MAIGVPMTDLEFQARRGLAAFEEHPWLAEWTDGRPALPPGFQVAIIGAGFSGIAAGVQMEKLGIPYQIFERQPEVGGVWGINKYPDARVDTASLTYEYTFEKNYPWSEYFAKQPEVQGYLEHVAKKYGLWEHLHLEHELVEATWDDRHAVWDLSVQRPDGSILEVRANAVISAVGTFANPKFVDFPGAEDFRGPIVHPTQWGRMDLDLTGKRVAVIGNGSTGVQLLAPVAQAAGQVYVFQRTPQWISPRPKYGQPVEPEIRWLLDTMPGYWNWSKFMSFSSLFTSHEFVIPDPEWQAQGGIFNKRNDELRTILTQYIEAQTGGRPDLVGRLVPDYAPMCRRPVVDNGWYQALTRDNVELVTDGITCFTATGIETEDGRHRDVDLVVAATGFEIVKYLWPAEYVGRGGMRLHERWATDGPRAYLSLMVPYFPNMFMLYGPNSQPLSGGTSLPAWYQIWSSYIAKALIAMIENGCSQVEVTEAAHDRYNEALDQEAAGTVLLLDTGSKGKNYYINEHGRLQMNAPWESPRFHAMFDEVDWDEVTLS
jgi:4-hydroxyacetophenone monooxygenase